jgi:hypothetical protein
LEDSRKNQESAIAARKQENPSVPFSGVSKKSKKQKREKQKRVTPDTPLNPDPNNEDDTLTLPKSKYI